MPGLHVKYNRHGGWMLYQRPAPRGKAQGSAIGPYDTKEDAIEAARSLVFGNGSAADVSGRRVMRNFAWYATFTKDGDAQKTYTGYENRPGNPLSVEPGDTVRDNMGNSYEVKQAGTWSRSKRGKWPYNAKVYGVRVKGGRHTKFIPYPTLEKLYNY